MVGMRHPWNRTNCIKIFHSFLPMLLGFSIFAGLLVSGTNTGARYVPGTPDCTWVQHTSRCHSSAIEVSVFLLFFFCFRDEEVRGWRNEEERSWSISKLEAWIIITEKIIKRKKKKMEGVYIFDEDERLGVLNNTGKR